MNGQKGIKSPVKHCKCLEQFRLTHRLHNLVFLHPGVITFIANNLLPVVVIHFMISYQYTTARTNALPIYISLPGAELIKDRGILYEGQTWKAYGCDFYFNGSLNYPACPLMARPVCYVFNGFVCCASQCPGRMLASVKSVKSQVKALGLHNFVRDLGWAYKRGAYKQNKRTFRNDEIKSTYIHSVYNFR